MSRHFLSDLGYLLPHRAFQALRVMNSSINQSLKPCNMASTKALLSSWIWICVLLLLGAALAFAAIFGAALALAAIFGDALALAAIFGNAFGATLAASEEVEMPGDCAQHRQRCEQQCCGTVCCDTRWDIGVHDLYVCSAFGETADPAKMRHTHAPKLKS